MEVVARALADGGVRAQQLKGSVHQKTAALGGFQREDGGEAATTCLLLNIGNESAAGANLTVANHAIFVHPILAESEHLYTVSAPRRDAPPAAPRLLRPPVLLLRAECRRALAGSNSPPLCCTLTDPPPAIAPLSAPLCARRPGRHRRSAASAATARPRRLRSRDSSSRRPSTRRSRSSAAASRSRPLARRASGAAISAARGPVARGCGRAGRRGGHRSGRGVGERWGTGESCWAMSSVQDSGGSWRDIHNTDFYHLIGGVIHCVMYIYCASRCGGSRRGRQTVYRPCGRSSGAAYADVSSRMRLTSCLASLSCAASSASMSR